MRDEERKNKIFAAWMTLLLLGGILLVVLSWASKSKAEEYSMVSDASKTYCYEYAQREVQRATDKMGALVVAYSDCISVLPERLPLAELQGTAPAADRPASNDDGWSEACEREYRSWDKATGTVVRRGSPDRVECPLVMEGGEWVVP